MFTPTPILDIRATWERSLLATSRDDVALMLSISAHRRATNRPLGRAPIDIAFILDRSGSMGGEKIELVKEAVNHAITYLSAEDRVSLVIFDNEIDVIQPIAPASSAIKASIRETLQRVEARGSTNLSDGWLTGCQQLAWVAPNQVGTRLQRAILLTDGQANMGITDPSELAQHATALRHRGISTTTMGVGEGFDEVLLSTMAEAGGGNFSNVEHPSQFAAFFEKEIGGLIELAALRPQIEITLPRGLRATLLNAFPDSRVGKTITVDLRDLTDRDKVDLVFLVTHRGNLGPTSTHVVAQARATDPESGSPVTFPVTIPPLTFVSDAEAEAAPVDNRVYIARSHEQSRIDQREALRLDREGDYAASRQLFAASHIRLLDANERAAASNYAGVSESVVADLREELVDLDRLAQEPRAPLTERDHKQRFASHANRSRGGRPTSS